MRLRTVFQACDTQGMDFFQFSEDLGLESNLYRQWNRLILQDIETHNVQFSHAC